MPELELELDSLITLSVRGLATTLVFLRGALIRTGIGALIVGAGELVYQFSQLVARVGGVAEAFRLLGDLAREVWSRIGLSLDAAAVTYDHSTPATRDAHGATRAVREERLGGAGFLPAGGSVLVSRLHRPQQLVALDVGHLEPRLERTGERRLACARYALSWEAGGGGGGGMRMMSAPWLQSNFIHSSCQKNSPQ